MGLKQWNIRRYDVSAQDEIENGLGLGKVASRVLAARGYDALSANRLINHEESIIDPLLLKDMDKAVERIHAALESGETIAVFGDYDCDGVTATAMLYSYFEMLGAKVYFYIPSREGEGYGLNMNAVDELNRLGTSLIVTVDNGVSAASEVEYAASLGIDIVITDHHKPPKELPRAVAIVNPHREDCSYPFKDLAGVGVAFKLVCALEGEVGYETLEHFSDLLALGTVADVVSLTGENRLFVQHGLRALGLRPGMAALIESCKLSGKRITASTLAFTIAPRINAAGRMGDSDAAVMLCLTDRVSEAKEYCARLEEFNQSRKELEKQISDEVAAILDGDPSCRFKRTLTLYKEGWNSGLLGIVCSRMVERYEKPCVLIGIDGGEARGSGRSLAGFSLIDAVTASAHLLTRFGGHPLAAGFTLPSDNAETFADELEQYAALHCEEMPTGCLLADCEVLAKDLSVENVTELERLEPFGAGNDTPLFIMRGLELGRIMPTADGRHLRLGLISGAAELTAVYFGVGVAQFPFLPGDKVDIVFNTDINLWNDKKTVNIKIKDIRLSGINVEELNADRARYLSHLRGERLNEDELPDRDDVAALYRLIRSSVTLPYDREYIACRLFGLGISFTKGALATDVLLELGLVEERTLPEGKRLVTVPGAAKADLQSSEILKRHRTQPATS